MMKHLIKSLKKYQFFSLPVRGSLCICGELLVNFITILRWMLIDLVAGKEGIHSYFKSESISILKFCLTSFPAMNAYIILYNHCIYS